MPKVLPQSDISDVESNDEGDIPANGGKEDEEAEDQVNGELQDEVEDTQNNSEDGDGKEDDEDEDGDDEVPDGEYEVEAIRNHQIQIKGSKKSFLLLIKWKGFPEADNTWEPEANLNDDSKKLMEAYFTSIGGRPDTERKTGPQKRKSATSLHDRPTSVKKSKRKGSAEELSTWTPASKDWEPEIERVDTVDRDPDTKKLNAYIIFKNGKRIKAGMEMVYKHCPRAMLRFYEDHLSV